MRFGGALPTLARDGHGHNKTHRHLTNAPGDYIKHVFVIIQENRSLNDIFMGFPNANTTSMAGQRRCHVGRSRLERLRYPFALAIDPLDRLYVANLGGGTVTVYSPGGANLLQTLRDGIKGPTSLAIGP